MESNIIIDVRPNTLYHLMYMKTLFLLFTQVISGNVSIGSIVPSTGKKTISPRGLSILNLN